MPFLEKIKLHWRSDGVTERALVFLPFVLLMPRLSAYLLTFRLFRYEISLNLCERHSFTYALQAATAQAICRVKHRGNIVACTFLALIGVFAVYCLRLDTIIGMVNDDGWYVLLAKSLATGQGYTLINSPVPGILPLYPPAYPFLLSFLWRLSPHFPANVWLLKSFSICAMFGAGLAAYYYFKRIRNLSTQISLFIGLLTTLSPAFVFFATSTLMSECLFTFVQLMTIIALEKVTASAKRYWLFLLLAVGGASVSFLTRSLAIALIAAAMLYFLKEKEFQCTLIFVLGCAVLLGPWIVYSNLHAPTPEQKAAQGGYIIYRYDESFWMKRAGHAASGTETIADLPARAGANILNMLCSDMIGIILPVALRSVGESGSEGLGIGDNGRFENDGIRVPQPLKIASIILSIIVIIGFVYQCRQRVTLAEIVTSLSLGVIVLWPWLTLRFVLPLMPFLLYYLIMGLQAIGAQIGKRVGSISLAVALPRVVLLSTLGLYGYDHLGYIMLKMQNPKSDALAWISEFEECQEVITWINKNTPADTTIAVSKPALVYLYTGRKTISPDFVSKRWDLWGKQGVRYVVSLTSHAVLESDTRLDKYPTVYKSPNEMYVLDLSPSLPDQATIVR